MNKVIIALATPPLKGALAMIRLTGEGVFEMTDKLFTKKVSGTHQRTIYFGTLSYRGNDIDQVCVYAYPAPHTVTGEDIVEISCHGSMLIANEIIEAYLALGASYAERGEFSSRAFYNGKMDLIEAESVNDLINASTKEAKNVSLMSLVGKTSKLVSPLKTKIADLLSLIEVNIDYPEYRDIEEANKETISRSIREIRSTLSDLIKGGEEGKIIKEGVKVAIVGEPNVGKSSLLNALLKEDKAIVSSIPGTTRDVVEGEVVLDGIQLHLLDTAGIRESSDSIERIGIEKSQKSIEKADLVILVTDASKGLSQDDETIIELTKGKPLIIAYNKKDLSKGSYKDGAIYISASNGDISSLVQEITGKIGISGSDSFSSPSLNSARQLGILRRIDDLLSSSLEASENDVPIDLISVDLQAAYNLTRELLGEGATLDLTDEIFSRFCVGK